MASSSVASRSSTTLVTPQIVALSEETVSQCDAHLWDYLSIEMIPLVLEAAVHAQARNDARRALVERDLQQQLSTINVSSSASDTANGPHSLSEAPPLQPVDNTRQIDEALRVRLETIGFRLGWSLSERLAKERPPILKHAASQSTASASDTTAANMSPALEPLEVVKFLCKDIWTSLYDKQIDNLRTNHRGVFVLQDNAFKPLLRLSIANPDNAAAREEGQRKALQLLAVPSGVIRGALAVLGLHTTVSLDYNGGSQCIFQVKTVQKPQ